MNSKAKRIIEKHKRISWLSMLMAISTSALLCFSSNAGAQAVSMAAPAPTELPTNGKVVAGTASITQNGSTMDINQSTQRGVIDWQTFNVGSQAQVNFNQPNVSAVTLNRVFDTQASQIFGHINANGQVFFTNPNGMFFSSTSSVDVGGLVATTHSISTEDFMSGNYTFNRDGSTGSVVNAGDIQTGLGGYIALLAPEVRNEGVLFAKMGTVALASGEAVTLNFDGNSLAGIVVEPSAIKALVENKGAVIAPGGTLILSAQALDQLQGGVVKNSGDIEATGLSVKDGHIVLDASSNVVQTSTGSLNASGDQGGNIDVKAGGDVSISGNVDAKGLSGNGGTVTLSGNRVGVFDSALIDVSGLTGGGNIFAGGGFHGQDSSISNAQQTVIGTGATLKADAINSGNGGNVAVWSNDYTNFNGNISARGGANGGDGGFVEVSSKGQLDFLGGVNTQAPQGHVGSLLLDPYNLTISSSSDTNVSGATPFDATGTGSILNVTTLQNALANSDVIVTTGSSGTDTGNLTVANTVGWFSDYSLTLSAAATITVNSGVSVIAAGNGNITLTSSAGDIVNNGAIRTYGGNLAVTTLDVGGGAIYGSGSYNVAGTASFTTAGNIGLTNTANKFAGAVSLQSTGGEVLLVNSLSTVLAGVTSGNAGISITSGGSVTDSGAPTGINAAAGPLSITTNSGTNGSITYTGPVSAGGNISLSADGNGAISLADINGSATFTSVVAGGAITLGDSGTGALTFDSGSGNVLSGTAGSSGQASGTATITGSSITINDPFVTKGGNLNLISTSGAVTANTGANITTTANTDTGTASGTVTVTAANGITLQNIVTTGADNSLGVGSNAAAVVLTATTGNLNVGAITTSGGAATTGASSNRNGGNAGNIIIAAPAGIIYLNGDLNAIGGSPVGTAVQGLGGYIDMENAVVLTADRSISSGTNSGDIDFQSTIDSDSTSRSLSITAGIGSVKFFDAVGNNAPLSTLAVNSSTTTTVQGNVTTDAAGGVSINATTINLGNDTVANGMGAITVNTLAGNGTVNLNSTNTYLTDAVTFTRGTGAISFTNDLYSKSNERNDLTFNGAGGGAITVGLDVGGTSAGAFSSTALGNILISTGTDLTFTRGIVAKSLVSLNTTGFLSLGSSTFGSYFDGASGYQIATTGTANNYSGDENIGINNSVTLTDAGAPLSITATNGSLSSSYAYNTLTTAGGNMTLSAGAGLTLPSNGSLTSSGGLISLTGVGVTQAANNSVNAGSGKIRVDGGNAAVSLDGTLTTTDADTGGSPAVLITRASSVLLRSVTAQTGTLQVGLVGLTNTLATTQSLGGAGSLTLTGNTSYYSPRRITLTGTGDNSAMSFTVTGTDASGAPVSQTISGANNGTATTTQYFATVTGISASGATSGNVTAGVANELITGSLTQDLPSYYTNAINIHTLSAASSAAITLNSNSNTIDQLGSFAVGSSLDVEAKGRSAGMLLTGDVTATDVTIKTGNGALVLGDYNITSTSGNVWLQGAGVTQTANSTITSVGATGIDGGDYQSGTLGNVTMAGSIISSSDVSIYSTSNLTLPNITIGSVGTRGTLNLGWGSGSGINGAISQTAGSAIKIGTLEGYQVAGDGTTDLTNANNEIQYIGSFSRGGAFSIYDADTEGNGLAVTGNLQQGNYSSNSPITLETSGALAIDNTTWGTGLIFSGSSITDNGAQVVSYRSTEIRAHGGDVTLNGSWYVNWDGGTGGTLLIRNAGNVQLGYLQSGGSATGLIFGAAGTSAALGNAQSSSGGALTLDGSSTSGGTATFTTAQRITVASSGNDSSVTFTVTGTDMFGRAQTETITGANATAAIGSKYFTTVTSINASGATAGSVTAGTATENISGNVTQTSNINNVTSLSGNVGGSIKLNNGSNSFQNIGNLTSGGDMTLYSAVNPLTVTGAALSIGGNVNISSGYGLTVSSTGSVAASGSGKSITLTSGNDYSTFIQGAVSAAAGSIIINSTGSLTVSSTGSVAASGSGNSATLTSGNDYSTTIQGAVSADTGGIVINSGSSFANNSTGTITTTGGVSIKTYWDGTNYSNLTLGGNVTAGANGIKLNSSGTINQTGGVLTTAGAVSGPDSSGGGAPGVSNPSARGSVTLNDNNQVGSLGPFYVYNSSGGAFSFNDTTAGLTLAGTIETSNGNIGISTAGGALNLATYGVYAGELVSGGSNVALTGQGITQASGTISATGSADGTTPRNGSSGGTITLTGYDGTSSGAINLNGTIQTANSTTSAVTIRGTTALVLPNISAPNGSLNVGDISQTYYQITGAITQYASTLLDIKTLNVAGASSAVLANTGNQIVQLGNIAVGDNAGVDYDFDVYNSTGGLSLTHDVTSAGGVRIVTAQGAGSSGALALGNFNIYAIGDIYLGALGITQGASSDINANYAGTAGSGGNIAIDGGGGLNNITLAGTVSTDGAGKSLSIVDATNATLNVISATAGTVALGTNSLPLSGSISLVASTGVVSASTLTGNAGIVNLSVANIDNLGAFTTTGALTLKDQGGAGPAGLMLTGNVTVGAASDIETSDGALDFGTNTIDASGGAGYDLVLKGVGVSQGTGSAVKSTTAEIYGGTGNIDLFSVLNDFTGQVTVNSTGLQVSIQDANQLSMNSLTGKLANTTSFTAWAGTNLVLTPESLTTTSGSIDLRSLNGNLSTPGNLTTGSGSVTLIAGGTGSNGNVQVNNTLTTGSGNVTVQASAQASLLNSIVSTSGNIAVSGDTVIHSTGSPGSPLTLQTAGAGTITVDASGTGGFVMGQYYSYQSDSGLISITSGATADLANIASTSGDVIVNAVGAVQQLASSSINANAVTVAATSNGAITLANANNNAAYISLRSLNVAGNAAGSGAITYNDLDAVAVRQIQTTGNATLTAGGAITTDTVTGPGTVTANALLVKTLNDSAADISLTAAGNDVTTLTLEVRNAADTANVGTENSTGNIDYTDANGFTIAGVESGGSAELTAGGAVVQTGAILVSGLGLSGTGSFTLNNALSGVPINQVNTFASNASGAVNFSNNGALTVGTVTAAGPITGVTSNGAAVTISATSIDSSAGPIDTRSSTPATAGGAVTLTTTGSTSTGNLTVGSINTSGSDAATSTNGNGGAAGTITLTSSGDTLSLGGVITARGGAGDGSGTTGADGLVALTANAGAVSQSNGSGTHAINAGKLLVSALNASSLVDSGNTTDFVAAKITGAGQGFTYRSASDYTVGAGSGTITGMGTQGGAIDLSSSNVTITDVEAITTKGGNFSANNVGGFNSAGVTLSTAGDITFAAGAYKNGGAVSITTTTGNITTGAIVTSGDSSASAATAGSVTLNADNVLTTGSITSTGAGTSVGAAVQLTGSTVRLGGPINTGGGTGGSLQAAGGNINVTSPAVVYGADLVLDTGSGAGDVTFSSSIDSDNIGSIRSLTVNSGSGNINLQGVLGGNVTLKNVALNSSGTSNIDAAVTATSLTTDATGTTDINGAIINTTGNQTYNDDVVLSADTTLTSGGNVTFAATVKSDGTNRALTVDDSGTTTFGGAVGGSGVAGDQLASLTTDAGGTTAINGGSIITTGTQTYGDNVTLGADTTLTGSTVTTQGTVTGNTRVLGIVGNAVFGNDSSDSVTGVTILAVSGTTKINTSTITSTGAQTYTGGVTLGTDVTLTGVGVDFASTVKSDGTNRALTINDSGTTTFGDAVGGSGVVGDQLASLTTDASGVTAINGGSVITTGAQTYGDNITLGADTALTGSTVTTQGTVTGNSHALNVTGNAVFGNDSSDSVTGVTTLAVGGTTAINTDTITSTGTQTYTGAVTLGTDTMLTGSAINFNSTVDSDAITARSLNLVSSGGAGQNFVAAVGGIHALNVLRIESVGVVTQGGSAPIFAEQLAIKSASGVTLTNASNAVDVLAALLSGNASLSFVDSTGLEIGTIGSGALQIIGISDGSGTSAVSITLGGPLTQDASSPITLNGNLAIDTSVYNAGDVTVDNTGAAGTVLGNSLIAGDFNLSSTGNVTQASGAYLQVGGNFNVNGGGSFVAGNSTENLIGGSSGSVSGNEIKLYGVITVSMDAGTGDLLASAWNGTSTTTASITSSSLASGVQVVSAAGGSSISAVNSGAAVTLNGTNNIGGSLSITTQGTYSSGGTSTATGINQSNPLNLSAASFTVQQSSANASSGITGAGALDLSNAGNAFAGTVSMSAVGMNATLAASTNIDLGAVNAQNVTVSTTKNITQAATQVLQADTLLVTNAQSVVLNNANLVNTLAASDLTGAMSFKNAQALTVGTASTVDGIGSSGSVLLQTTSGDLVLDKNITVSGNADITLASAANFTNNAGANALTVGTGNWQVWSTDPSLDMLDGLVPNFKQYNATYGSSTVLGSGNGVLYTLAPQLTIALTGTVERGYDADVDATLTQANYNVSGTVGSDAVVLGTSGTFDDKNVNSGKTITVNPVVVSVSDGTVQVYGYQIDSGSTTISAAIGQIKPATITAVTGITASSKTYDGTNSATLDTSSAVGFTGLFNGDQLSVATAAGNFASANASASPITVNITGISLGGTDASNYTLSTTTASTTALINAYVVNLSGSRVYDGTTNVAAGNLTIGTLVGSQTLNLSGIGTMNDKHVGTGKAVNIGTLTLGDGTNGGLASNYTLVGDTRTVDISTAPLTISTSDVTKTYDGSLTAAGSAIATTGTVFSGDTLSGGTYAFTNANAGSNKTVTVTGVTVNDGNSGGDYNVTYADNTASLINAEAITISTSNVSRAYNGALNAIGTPVVTSGTLYNNASNSNVLDSLSGGTYAFTDANAGTGNKTVTVGGVTVSDGNSGGNYTVTYANNTSSTISPENITISTSNVTKTYDSNTTALGTALLTTGTLYNNASNSNVLDSLSGGTFAFTSPNAGSGNRSITVGGVTVNDGNSGGNYNVTYADNTTSTINPYLVNLTGTRVYDGTTNIASGVLTIGALVGSDTLTLSGTGTVANKNVGTGKAVSSGTLALGNGSGLASNYTLSGGTSTVDITMAPLTVSTSDVTKTYDGGLSASGTPVVASHILFGGDTLSGGTYVYADSNVGSGNKIVTANGVTVNDGNSGNNYLVTYADNTTSTINPFVVNLTGSRTYDGTATADASSLTLGTLVNGETLSLSGSGAAASKNAGLETVNTSGLTLGDGTGLASNYTFTDGTQTINIAKANLTITTSNVTKTYDGSLTAAGTAVATAGTVFTGDTLSGGTYAFTNVNAGSNKTVAVTGVTVNDGNNGDNYVVSYANNTTSTISQADITVSTSNVTKTYDATLSAAGTITLVSGTLYNNASNGNVLDSLSGGSFAFTDPNAGSNDKAVAVSNVTVNDGNSGNNYVVTYVDNTASTINKATLSLAPVINDKEYDGTNLATIGNYGFTGLVGSETLSATFTSAVFGDQNAGVGKSVTVNGITLQNGTNGGLAMNYTAPASALSTGNILPKLLTANVAVSDKVYDGNTSATITTYGLSGFVGSETLVGVSSGSANFIDKNAGDNKSVSITGIGLINGTNGGVASNYTVASTASTSASITPAPLQVAGVVAIDKVYDGTTAANVNTLAAQLTGVIGSDDVHIGTITGTFASKNVGTAIPVTGSGFVLTGTDGLNYNLVQPTGLVANITPRNLAITATGVDKVYDGTTVATVTLSDNRIAGDVFSVSSSAAFLDDSVGVGKFVNVTDISLNGVDAIDYTASSNASTFASITAANEVTTPVDVVPDYLPAVLSVTNTTANSASSVTPDMEVPLQPVTLDAASVDDAMGPSNKFVGGVMNVSNTLPGVMILMPSLSEHDKDLGDVEVQLISIPSSRRTGVIAVYVPDGSDQYAQGFAFPLPRLVADTATADTVTVTTMSGEPMPDWLQYVPATKTFVVSNAPSVVLPLQMQVRIGNQPWIIKVTKRRN